MDLSKRLADFNRYFTSSNSAAPNARISVPTAEWQALHKAIADSLASAGGVPWVSMRECGSHHYTPENIAAIVADLKAVEKGVEQPEWVNRDHRTSCGILWRVISALANDVPLNADAAGGVEVVAYLVSGGRIFKDQAVTHKDSARTRIAERKDGSVAHPLVKQSDYLAALSKEREVADGLRAELEEARRVQMEALEVVRSVMEDAYHRRTAVCCGQAQGECCGNFMETWTADDLSIMDKLSPIEQALSKALTAHRESRGAAIEAKEG